MTVDCGIASAEEVDALVAAGLGVRAVSRAAHLSTDQVEWVQADVTDGLKPLSVNFDASGSHDPDGSIADFEWDFDGNGVYNEPGNGEEAARVVMEILGRGALGLSEQADVKGGHAGQR